MNSKWSHLVEADDKLRVLERKYAESGLVTDLVKWMSEKHRVGKLITCKSPPRTQAAWSKIAAAFEAQMPRPITPGQRFIQLSFRHQEVRQLFMRATDCIRPQLSVRVMGEVDQPNLYPVEIELARAIRAPRLTRVNFQQETAPDDHPQVQAGQYYNNPQMITFRLRGREYNTVIGAGSNDDTSLWRLQGDAYVYLLSYNTGMGYVGLTEYWLSDEDVLEHNEVFLDNDQGIQDALGPSGLELPETLMVRRLMDRL